MRAATSELVQTGSPASPLTAEPAAVVWPLQPPLMPAEPVRAPRPLPAALMPVPPPAPTQHRHPALRAAPSLVSGAGWRRRAAGACDHLASSKVQPARPHCHPLQPPVYPRAPQGRPRRMPAPPCPSSSSSARRASGRGPAGAGRGRRGRGTRLRRPCLRWRCSRTSTGAHARRLHLTATATPAGPAAQNYLHQPPTTSGLGIAACCTGSPRRSA